MKGGPVMSKRCAALRPDECGVCHYCGCSEFDPCPDGCAWANLTQTVCTECAPLAAAEERCWTAVTMSPQARLAFRRAFVVGWFGLAIDKKNHRRVRNPYRFPPIRAAWDAGVDHGAAECEVHVEAGGLILNAPRPFVYAVRLRRAA